MNRKLILLTGVALAWATPAAAAEPTEEIKKRALLLGYILNGNSMVRPLSAGSIDVSELALWGQTDHRPRPRANTPGRCWGQRDRPAVAPHLKAGRRKFPPPTTS